MPENMEVVISLVLNDQLVDRLYAFVRSKNEDHFEANNWSLIEKQKPHPFVWRGAKSGGGNF